MLITDHLRAENALLQMASSSKTDLLRATVDHLKTAGAVTDAETCLTALLDRERLMTTGVGKGVALPHAFTPAAPETVITYLRVVEGVDFEAVDEAPVHHVFCILGPTSAQGRHLKILARLSRLLNHQDFLDALNQATTSEALMETLRSHEAALQPH